MTTNSNVSLAAMALYGALQALEWKDRSMVNFALGVLAEMYKKMNIIDRKIVDTFILEATKKMTAEGKDVTAIVGLIAKMQMNKERKK